VLELEGDKGLLVVLGVPSLLEDGDKGLPGVPSLLDGDEAPRGRGSPRGTTAAGRGPRSPWGTTAAGQGLGSSVAAAAAAEHGLGASNAAATATTPEVGGTTDPHKMSYRERKQECKKEVCLQQGKQISCRRGF
jgi:hypothetical protein